MADLRNLDTPTNIVREVSEKVIFASVSVSGQLKLNS